MPAKSPDQPPRNNEWLGYHLSQYSLPECSAARLHPIPRTTDPNSHCSYTIKMPIVVSNEGWVKLPPKPRKAAKPKDPSDFLRGPLAYITGRPELKEPVKKQSINQLLIEAAVPPPSPRKPRNRVPSAPAASKSRHRAVIDSFEEADEEIVIVEEDLQSRRSASPVGTRHARAAPSVRSRRYESTRSVYEPEDSQRLNRSRRHESSRSVYDEPASKHERSRRYHGYEDEPRHYRSHAGERSYHPRSYSEHYAAPPMPQLQPIVIYSTQPSSGCGGHHSCTSPSYQQHQYQCHAPPPRPMIEALPSLSSPHHSSAPRPPPSEASSKSSRSGGRAMSYKWYTATQPLNM